MPTDHTPPPVPAAWTRPPSGRVLCFSPHPDDEVLGPGGALILHARQGDAIRVVIACDGAAGDPDRRYPAATYAELRRGESRAGLAVCGVQDVAFWGLPDSCEITDADLEMVAGRAAEQLAQWRPDVVYLPWEGESNSDHRALHKAVVRALRRARFAGKALAYEVWSAMVPDAILDVTPVVETKRRAIECYHSQLSYVDLVHPTLGLNAQRSLAFNRGRGYGEAFRFVDCSHG